MFIIIKKAMINNTMYIVQKLHTLLLSHYKPFYSRQYLSYILQPVYQ